MIERLKELKYDFVGFSLYIFKTDEWLDWPTLVQVKEQGWLHEFVDFSEGEEGDEVFFYRAGSLGGS